MKKVVNAFLVISLLLMSGCNKEENKTIQDGIYSQISQGYNGDVEVEVTISDGAITDVIVTNENETDTWADDAIENTGQYIVDEQSVSVDVSSGATLTSKAIMKAVEEVIKEAGGNIEEWNGDATGKHETKEETKETQVVIIGGGIAGISTALRLRQADIECILVEEDEELGGTLLYGGSYSQIVCGSEEIEEEEEEVNTPSQTLADIKEYSCDTADSDILKILEDNIGETVDWQINDLGIVFAEEWTETSSYSAYAVKEYAESNSAIGELLAKEAEVSGAEILTDTIMMNLETEGEDVCGIQAKAKDGTLYHIHADTVVIATGASFQTDDLSIGSSSEILTITEECETDTAENILTNLAFAVNETHALDTYDANREAMDSGLIIVNDEGDRFVNETISRNDLSDACEGESYLVMSAGAYSKWKTAMCENGQLTDEEIDLFDELVSHGETLQEAASLCTIPYEELLQTVNLFNAEVKNDASDIFLREDMEGTINPQKDVYIVKLSKATYASTDGLTVNPSLQAVLNGNVIDNVYVVGSAAGNVLGERVAEGLPNAWAFVSGKVVADTITGEANE